ncbi:RNA polymerase sigma-54 factor [Ochrobactrum quorumnocens]|uniref:RNA polymerase sigma-54 factor n=1 Tax=Ochrobactrum quorumnocens TaxID=271865 RepID=A0A248UEN2_9HYPH|nr:RNA polymerase factor sigma-54 [[Ochrobactrum] quorumnocens]ASV84861.1 RNA polymerase sigma-54 factor [[Ochrobactrum] quorumnocens]
MNINMTVNASVRQTQQLTRQAIQAVEMLELGQGELEDFLHDQCERNPLLSLEPAPDADTAPSRLSTPGRQQSNPAVAANSDRLYSLEAVLRYQISLREHLQQQVTLAGLPANTLAAAQTIIDYLEPDGYFRQDIGEMADLTDLPICDLERALDEVQKLEPVGVGARNLKECLSLQLLDKGPVSESMAALIDNLHILERGEVAQLCRRCQITTNELSELLHQLRQLEPKPGRAFELDPVCPALPDILVTTHGSERIRVEMNPELLPRLLLDQEYYEDLSLRTNRNEEKEFLRNCLRDARHLVRNLNQRTVTMLKIASAVVRHQEQFFRLGDEGFRPLSQRQIALALKVHESTVSRAIANKSLLCDRGLFALKSFFSDGVGSEDGEEELASTVIRHRIKTLTAEETADNVLSDDAIVSMLKRDGVGVARRTVAKYRSQMRIPSSAQRKRNLQLRQLVPCRP